MILVDLSSTIHRMIHTAVRDSEPRLIDDKYVTSDFIGLVKDNILRELFSIKQEHGNRFGDLVVCLDRSVNGYWRHDVLPSYKSSRKVQREQNNIDFKEVFKEIDVLVSNIKANFPWKVIGVPRAEADDVILVLARAFNNKEQVLIYSPDKDMIQAQRNTNSVFQYSGLTKKWIVPENKHDNMDEWIQEHVILGDTSDGVPKVVDHTEFSDSFLEHLITNGFTEIKTPMDFDRVECNDDEKRRVLENFNVYKLNRKKESTGVLDVYKTTRFGPSTLKKQLDNYGSVDKWLDSHPLYREHYDRNFTLVMEEGIPDDIRDLIIAEYSNAEDVYNEKEVRQYLTENNLQQMLLELPTHLKIDHELTLNDLDW